MAYASSPKHSAWNGDRDLRIEPGFDGGGGRHTAAEILGTTSVLIGGIAAPLYYVSPGQVNAQIPFELAPGKRYQVQVINDGAASTPMEIAVVAAPGIAATPNGKPAAQHADYSLVTADSPAKPGEYVVLYLAALGPVDNAVASGEASPASPLGRPLDPPILLANGSPIQVAFAGLSPGWVGLYQMNFQIPADAPDGDLLLQVKQSTGISNAVTLPVKR